MKPFKEISLESIPKAPRTSLLTRRGRANRRKDEVEEFVCKMYKLDSIGSVNEARVILFSKKGKPEALPPTSDALSLHVKRVHYQVTVWKQAHCSEPHLPDPETLGWKKIADNKLQPLLMT